MRLLLLVLFFFSTSELYAQARYTKIGVPPSETEWSHEEYEAAWKVLAQPSVRLPQFSNRHGKPVLERILSLSNLKELRDETLSLDDRIGAYQSIFSILDQMTEKYVTANKATPKWTSEQAALLEFSLRVGVVGVDLLQEKVASIPVKDIEQDQLKKVKEMGGEISRKFEEVERALSETELFTQAELLSLLVVMEETLPSIVKVTSSDTRFSMANHLTGHLGDAGAQGDALIQSMLKVLFPSE